MLVKEIAPLITKQTTIMRRPIDPEVKLAITLRFLATGESFESLMYQFRVHSSTIAKFIPEVCTKIYEVFKERFMRLPNTAEEWEIIEHETRRLWQFPNCIGAADGKHVSIINPANSGSEFFNYKGFFSIVLLAIVDYDYKFIFADVGCQGRISDGGVYRNSFFYRATQENLLDFPPDKPLPSSNNPFYDSGNAEKMPYVFLADDAFPLGKHCLKPYAQSGLTPIKRIFNYRLSRVRRVTENAFGILTNRFRVFTTKMCLDPDKATVITLSTLVLHNMLRELSNESYTPDGFIDVETEVGDIVAGEWRNENIGESVLQSLPKSNTRKATKNAQHIRDSFADHFWGPGQIPWQWKML